MLSELFQEVVQFLVATIGSLGYPGIFILMTIESTFLPLIPSELVIIPAGIQIAEGSLSFTGVLAAGVLGSLAGAFINYFLALYLGRAAVNHFLQTYGKFLFITRTKLERAERFFTVHGAFATLLGRLVIGLRHFISLPAGFLRMPISSFTIYTAIGLAFWVAFLAYLGMLYVNKEEYILTHFNQLALLIALGVGSIVLIYIIMSRNLTKTTP